MKTKQITLTALMLAATFVVTRFIQIPIPLGYFNIGNVVILLSCLMLPLPYGIIVGSFGSALADFTSFPAYTIPTLIIKALMPLVFYLIVGKSNSFVRKLVASLIATLIPLFGYTLVGGILAGNLIAGLAQFPGLLLEYIANFILLAISIPVFEKVKAQTLSVNQ